MGAAPPASHARGEHKGNRPIDHRRDRPGPDPVRPRRARCVQVEAPGPPWSKASVVGLPLVDARRRLGGSAACRQMNVRTVDVRDRGRPDRGTSRRSRLAMATRTNLGARPLLGDRRACRGRPGTQLSRRPATARRLLAMTTSMASFRIATGAALRVARVQPRASSPRACSPVRPLPAPRLPHSCKVSSGRRAQHDRTAGRVPPLSARHR